MHTTPKETVPQKASRLVGHYRVILTGPSQALLIGDHDTYQVEIHSAGSCQCKWMRYQGWRKPCSHILAARTAVADPTSQIPVARLATILRKEQPR